MKLAGFDIGSATVKAVVVEDGEFRRDSHQDNQFRADTYRSNMVDGDGQAVLSKEQMEHLLRENEEIRRQLAEVRNQMDQSMAIIQQQQHHHQSQVYQ